MTTLTWRSLRYGLLLPILTLANLGCFAEIFMAKRVLDRANSTSYSWELKSVLEEEESEPGSRGYLGLLPADLASFRGGMPGTAPGARSWRGQARLHFVGVSQGEICFERSDKAEVSEHGEAALQRVDREMRAYRYALEIHDPATFAAAQQRSEVWPQSESVALERVTLISSTWLRGKRDCPGSRWKKCLVTTHRVCGPAPSLPAEPHMMTVAVDPERTPELNTNPYLLFWELRPAPLLSQAQ